MNDVTYAGGTVVSGTREFGSQLLFYVETWGPRIIAALIILGIGWLVARGAKWAVAKLVNRTPLARHANEPGVHARHPDSVGAQVGEAAYWVVLLIALFLASQPLGLTGATGPLGDMLAGFGQAVPNIIGAGLIFFLGYVLAKVARKAVEAVVTASHVERFSARLGADTPADAAMLPRTLGAIVFALIIIPVAIAALDTLNIAAISQPATAMLQIILDAIPHVVAAGLILAVAYVIGKFASRLLTQFLATTGFDHAIGATGLWNEAAATVGNTSTSGEPATTGSTRPSRVLGTGVFVAVVIFGLMEAFRQLDFAYGSEIMAQVLTLFGQVVFGSVIIFAAVVIARLIGRAIETGQQGNRVAGQVVRVAIIVLGTAIGLRFMGLADDIINMAFGLLLGAVAVAFALAFGLGGREPAKAAVSRLLGQAEDKADAKVEDAKSDATDETDRTPYRSSDAATRSSGDDAFGASRSNPNDNGDDR